MFTSTSLELNFIPSLRREAFWDFKTIPKLTKVPLICDYLSELVSIEFILVTSYKGEGGGGEGEGGGGGGLDLVVSVFSKELDLCMKERMQVYGLKVRSVTF